MGIDQEASDTIIPFQDITTVLPCFPGISSSAHGKISILSFEQLVIIIVVDNHSKT